MFSLSSSGIQLSTGPEMQDSPSESTEAHLSQEDVTQMVSSASSVYPPDEDDMQLDKFTSYYDLMNGRIPTLQLLTAIQVFRHELRSKHITHKTKEKLLELVTRQDPKELEPAFHPGFVETPTRYPNGNSPVTEGFATFTTFFEPSCYDKDLPHLGIHYSTRHFAYLTWRLMGEHELLAQQGLFPYRNTVEFEQDIARHLALIDKDNKWEIHLDYGNLSRLPYGFMCYDVRGLRKDIMGRYVYRDSYDRNTRKHYLIKTTVRRIRKDCSNQVAYM